MNDLKNQNPATRNLIHNLAAQVCQHQDQYTLIWHESNPAIELTPFWILIMQQHRQNFDLWHQEDKARTPQASDHTIATLKRSIDTLNQHRHDLISQVDDFLSQTCFADCHNQNLPWNSETIGNIIDRLSIFSLKIYHMRTESLRTTANSIHRNVCQKKLALITAQRSDLTTALQSLADDILAGRKQHKTCHPFKMYNDPTLNPAIYSNNPT